MVLYLELVNFVFYLFPPGVSSMPSPYLGASLLLNEPRVSCALAHSTRLDFLIVHHAYETSLGLLSAARRARYEPQTCAPSLSAPRSAARALRHSCSSSSVDCPRPFAYVCRAGFRDAATVPCWIRNGHSSSWFREWQRRGAVRRRGRWR